MTTRFRFRSPVRLPKHRSKREDRWTGRFRPRRNRAAGQSRYAARSNDFDWEQCRLDLLGEPIQRLRPRPREMQHASAPGVLAKPVLAKAGPIGLRFPPLFAARKVTKCPQDRHIVPGHSPLCDLSAVDAEYCAWPADCQPHRLPERREIFDIKSYR
jgi:hypothetical protein